MSDDLKLKAAEMVEAYVSHNQIEPEKVPALLQSLIDTLTQGSTPAPTPRSSRPVPAVPIEESVHDDYLICLEDGAKMKLLKRYLKNNFNLTPSEYIKKWGLPADYPMVCKNYSLSRSKIAKEMGLGKS